MPVQVSYIAEEDRLDLSFHGKLDLTLSQEVCDLCRQVPAGLRACIIDLTDITQLFDSGIALIYKLHRRLTKLGAIVVILSDRPDIRRWIPTMALTPPRKRPLRPFQPGIAASPRGAAVPAA
jgi:anti-anti-sigma regulatory factor